MFGVFVVPHLESPTPNIPCVGFASSSVSLGTLRMMVTPLDAKVYVDRHNVEYVLLKDLIFIEPGRPVPAYRGTREVPADSVVEDCRRALRRRS